MRPIICWGTEGICECSGSAEEKCGFLAAGEKHTGRVKRDETGRNLRSVGTTGWGDIDM